MSHLAPEQLVELVELPDLAEGTQGQSEAARLHLASCDACRGQLADLQAALAALVETGERRVPEPSPLFWEHLSTRIQDAIATEVAPRPARGLDRWLSWKMAVPAAACLVVLLAVVVTQRTSSAPTPTTAAVDAVAPTAPAMNLVDAADAASWNLVTDLAGGLDWDAAVEAAGLTAPAGGIDRALFDLSVDERREFQRLLKEELSRSGA